jgi:hypothetical protein
MNKSFDQSFQKIVTHIRRGSDLSPHVLLGPLVWEGNPDNRQWYFLMGSGDRNGFRLDALKFSDLELGEQTRLALHFALLQIRPSSSTTSMTKPKWLVSLTPSGLPIKPEKCSGTWLRKISSTLDQSWRKLGATWRKPGKTMLAQGGI